MIVKAVNFYKKFSLWFFNYWNENESFILALPVFVNIDKNKPYKDSFSQIPKVFNKKGD